MSKRVTKIEKLCENCGNKFTCYPGGARRTQVFCSKGCATSSRYEKKKVDGQCQYCGIDFVMTTTEARRGRRFCSPKCARAAERKSIYLTCQQCGKSFSRIPSEVVEGTKYCSLKCLQSSKRNGQVYKCHHCGNEIYRSPSQVKEKMFCSRECSERGRGRRQSNCITWYTCKKCDKKFKGYTYQPRLYCSKACRYSIRTSPPAQPVSFSCGWCGKKFSRFRGKFGPGCENHFCSKECESNWRCNGGMPSGQDHPEYNSIIVHCANCDKELIRQPHRANGYKRQFCDMKCAGEWQSKNKTGKNHPNWKGGQLPGYRGPNWSQQSRSARKRDGYKCQHCGISQKKNGRQLDVHHIIPFRTFGYIPDENDHYLQANELSNLISLCSICHKKAEWGSIPIQPILL